MSGGPISGPGASPTSQQLPDTKALDEAKETEVVRLKNGKFKVGTSKGSVFNRTVRKVLMPKTYQREAQKATQSQQSAAIDAVQTATGRKFANVSLGDRQITVAQFRRLLSPPPPKVPASVADVLGQPDTTAKDVFNALQGASKGLHEGKQYKHADLAGGARFGNIHSPHKTAIQVQVPKKDNPGELESKPFHANLVGENYIATQAPMGSKESPGLMIQMLYNEKTSTVVNLTNPADADKGNMTYQYWPDKGQTQQHGDLLVQTTDIEKQDGFDVITLRIGQEGNYGNDLNSDTAREVKIFHFHGWPDHGVPEGDDVEKFSRFMGEVEARGESGRTTVHCRAGVGRTGVFVALDQLKQEARDGTLDRSNLLTRAAEVVWSGREDRGEQFVQREIQFKFIISELEKELTIQEELRSTTTDVSDLSELDDEFVSGGDNNTYENTSSSQTSSNFEAPPPYSEISASTVFDKLNTGAYDTNAEVIEDIQKVEDYTEMNALYEQFSDWEQQSTGAQQERFKELKDAAYNLLIRM